MQKVLTQMKRLPGKRPEEIWAERYSKGLKNQNGEYLVNLYKSNTLETQVIFLMGSELARTFFPFESTNNIKIKVTRLRVIEDGMHLGKNITCTVSVPYKVLKCSQSCCSLKKIISMEK